ncbi:MAG TPA: YihY/virulence factor BrkB family protein [Nocardioides sp.]|uniref:YihY/virulence factor BrkB family protein n=1 Tax=Nocardioides sp. TaxID=35761 RepID=UPI002C85B58F|nr:YihY/virulence factor BrkB family protein [Nocardioides sp.]HTW18103.1 YihY/virulence factor BrkB family protein [Nocardioides sp.]
MPAISERVTAKVADVRRRRPVVDHLVLMQEHFGNVKAGQQAGAVTYFAFLSFFPILALAVFVLGRLSSLYDGPDPDLVETINSVVPGIVGNREDQISLDDIRTFSGWAAVLGLAGVLYTGLGWISALRDALLVVFETPQRDQPGFVPGKLRDLVALVVLGVVLLVAVALTGFVAGFSGDVLGWFGLGSELGWLVRLLTIGLGLGANAVLFFLMFRLLADPHVPRRSLWSGALVGGVVFELLKQLSGILLEATRNQPAFQAFGIALVLVVWMNYTSRVILYAASWAYTTPDARAARWVEPAEPVQGPRMPSREEVENGDDGRPTGRAAFAAGAVAGAAAAAVVRKVKENDS